MKKIFFYCGDGNSLIDFRGHLIKKYIENGYEVFANTPNIRQDNLNTLQSWGVKLIESDIQRKSINLFSSMHELFQLIRCILRNKPSIIFAYTHKPVLVAAFAGFFCRVPNRISLITGTGHLFDNYDIKTRFRRFIGLFLFKIALTFSHKVIFQNPDNLELFLELGLVKKDKTHVVNGSGVDLEKFAYHPLPNNKTFLCLARLIKSKGLLEYAKAAKIMKEAHPEYSFLLGGPEDAHMDSISADEIKNEWGERYGVEYIGNISNPYEAIKECDVYVLLSYNEGTPRSVLEALATGRPVITTDVPGCRETVNHAQNGFLVEVCSVESAVEYMSKIIQSDLSKMSLESRKFAEKKYDVHNINKKIFKIIQSA